ncbi:MAG: protein-glutamate O-methyltransferase CheR [Rhodospirillaceae bacterium]|nr:protein-glutamate O-methyltransferase CheR [Rhodospirillaceae bacterium]
MNREDFAFLAQLLKDRSGLVLPPERAYLLDSRLLPVVRKWKLADVGAIVRAIVERSDEALVRDVVESMTTSETHFFRGRETFYHLRDEALPALLAARPAGRPLRIWSAACSTGQEPYSIAMLMLDLGIEPGSGRVEIVATDISTESLTRAREGLYSQFEVQRGLPVRLLLRHFDQIGERWQIKPNLLAPVSFRNFNLLSDPAPLGTFDIVLCRHVLMYFDAETQARVLERVRQRLAEDGFLYLGPEEKSPGIGAWFRSVGRGRGIFAPLPQQRAAPAVEDPALRMAGAA